MPSGRKWIISVSQTSWTGEGLLAWQMESSTASFWGEPDQGLTVRNTLCCANSTGPSWHKASVHLMNRKGVIFAHDERCLWPAMTQNSHFLRLAGDRGSDHLWHSAFGRVFFFLKTFPTVYQMSYFFTCDIWERWITQYRHVPSPLLSAHTSMGGSSRESFQSPSLSSVTAWCVWLGTFRPPSEWEICQQPLAGYPQADVILKWKNAEFCCLHL